MVECMVVLMSACMLAVALGAMVACVVEYSPASPMADFADHTVVVREVFPCVIYDAADDIVAWHDIVSSLDEIYQEISVSDHAPLADPCSDPFYYCVGS